MITSSHQSVGSSQVLLREQRLKVSYRHGIILLKSFLLGPCESYDELIAPGFISGIDQ